MHLYLCHALHDRDINASFNILQIGLKDQLFLGAGRPKVKPLENTTSGSYVSKGKVGSMKKETQGSLALGSS